MCKEFLSLHIGQAGVQSSHALWELVCIEHGIGADGILRETKDEAYTGENVEAMFYEIKSSRMVPRAILIDLEPTVVDEVRMGCYRDLWNPANIVNQKEDAASNYARGYYTSGKSFIRVIIERVNRELERCDNLSAFEIVHSYGGGTGSGLTALTYETISELYGKKFRFSLGVFPSPTISEIMVEPYNAVLHASSTLPTEDCGVIFDNESLFKKSLQKLNVSQPTFCLMNRLLSQMFSSISLSHRYRFFGSQHADVTELLTNLVPYPRIHFPIMSYSPLISFTEQSHEQFTCARLTNDVFEDDSHVIQCSMRDNKFMSCCMLYRGIVSPKPIIDAIAKIKRSRDINFVEWCPTGFKIGLNTCPPIQIPQCEQAIGDNALCMISGNTGVRECWGGLMRKFDLLMSKRAFVHWYVAEGLEEGEFTDSRESIQTLIIDYEELASDAIDGDSIEDLKLASNTQTNQGNLNSDGTPPFNISDQITSTSNFDRLFQTQHNQSHLSEKVSEFSHSTKLKPTKRAVPSITGKINRVNNKLKSSVLITKEKGSRQNIQQFVSKCHEVIKKTRSCVNEQKKADSQVAKRNRNKTRDLDIKNIGITVAKYLSRQGISPSMHSSLSKQDNPSITRNNSFTNSNVNTSRSYTVTSSSNNEELENYQKMKNNNKDQSVYNSSASGSFQSTKQTSDRSSISVIRNKQGKLRVIDQLLRSSVDRKKSNLNLFEISNGLGETFETIISRDKKLYLNSVGILSTKRNLSLDIIPNLDNDLRGFEDPITNDESVASIDTKMSQHFKMQNLTFSNYETVSCEPVFFYEKKCSSTTD